MNHAPFAIKETLLFGFRAFKHNLWLLIGISLLALAIDTGSQIIINLIAKQPLFSDTSFKKIAVLVYKNNASSEVAQVTVQQEGTTEPQTQSPQHTLVQLLLMILITIIAIIAQLYVLMGWNQIALDIYDTGTSSFNRLLTPSKKIWQFYAAALLYSVICSFGTLLLIIPGIVWAIRYSLADLIIVDSESTAMEALKASAQLTYGYKWDILFFYFVSCLIVFASLITLIGPFILIYVLFLSRVYIYRKLQGRWQIQHQPPTPFMP